MILEQRVIKMSEIKRAVQSYKKAISLMRGVLNWTFLNGAGQQIGSEDLTRIAKLFGYEVQKVDVDDDSWIGAIWIDGLKLYAYKYEFNADNNRGWKYKNTKEKFKQAFFDSDGNKEKAFELMKNQDNLKKYKDLENYKTISELEKFWHRQEHQKSNEQYMQEYSAYRSQWERGVGEEDYYFPYTFKEWFKKKQ